MNDLEKLRIEMQTEFALQRSTMKTAFSELEAKLLEGSLRLEQKMIGAFGKIIENQSNVEDRLERIEKKLDL